MFSSILVLLFINLAIFLNFKKFAEVINVYDAPDKKLKLHKKKNSNSWWINFNNQLLNLFVISITIF